jgi:hypothetical protein
MSARPDQIEVHRLSRLHELRFWLRGHGCCWLCALRYALAQVEKEAGMKFEGGSQCASDGKCAEKARAAWKSMPAVTFERAA